MEKITYQEACKMLEEGKTVKVKVSSRETVPVKNLDKLINLKLLAEQGVQECEIYASVKAGIPEDAMEISMDDALKLIKDGEIIYGKTEYGTSEDDEEITTQNALIQYYRSALANGEPVLYWK